MYKYYIKRILRSFLTLFIVITVVFILLRQMPEEGYFGSNYDKLDEVQKEETLKKLGLRDPMVIQLKNFYTGILKGDFGKSIKYRRNVAVMKIIKGKIPYSLYFGLAAFGLSLVLGISLGILMARYKGKFCDKLGTVYIVIINAVPAAVYYLFIQLYLTGLFNIPLIFDIDKASTWILPAVSMSLGSTASYAMWMRRYMVDELNKDYVRLARAKGLRDKQIMVKHVMRNAIVPMVQYMPASLLYTISGSIYIESLYSIPGMGGLLVNCIQQQDNTIVQSLVLIYSSIGIIGLLLGDILMSVFDPRIRLESKGGSR